MDASVNQHTCIYMYTLHTLCHLHVVALGRLSIHVRLCS